MSNHVASFASGAWGSADALRPCMGWEPGPAHCSTNNSVIHGRGLSFIYPWPRDADGRLPSLPILWAICPGTTPVLQTQALTENVHVAKAFENHGVAIFYTKCQAQWWEIFCRKFIHNYSCLTEIEMYSVLFWLSKYCCCVKKSDSPIIGGSQALPTTVHSALSNIQTQFNICILFLALLWGNGSLNLNLICPAAVFIFSSDCVSHIRSKDTRIL